MEAEQIDTLAPVLGGDGPPTTEDGRWIGEVQLSQPYADTVKALDSDGYQQARLLVRNGRTVLGFIEVGIDDGVILGREVCREMSRLPERAAHDSVPADLPPVSVVLCTRDRTAAATRAVESLLAMDYPQFEVVVVDNAATTLDTWRYVDSLADPRVRAIHASVPGLAAARNRGLEAATHAIVAFTDDDVVVDRYWLERLVAPLSDPAVACVTGLVPAAQLRTAAQCTFEQRVRWANSLERREYRRDDPSHGKLFPFRVGDYGTGANFAVRRSVAFALGGFDEALGAGSPAKGGEDIDWFVRTIVAGHTLVFEPDAITWHQHRDDDDALSAQAHGYGLGLGAWLTKIAFDRDLAPLALARAGSAVAHLVTSFYGRAKPRSAPSVPSVTGAARAEFSGLIAGPRALLTARSQGRKPKPFRHFGHLTASERAAPPKPEPSGGGTP
ncbi:glycosyltransferase [Gordonia sp. NPDC003585]|uniref:glycosyltransferase n=1 Tax=Gordonia sp. NPDC003585 TaxID=3154275 RepID=UPI0033B0B145